MLITQNLETIARMSCNPAMGGIAKGQIIREIDALGGISGIVSDLSAVQYKMLNKSKGPVKLLNKGDLKTPINIEVSFASKNAIEKVKAVGGNIKTTLK